MAIQLSDSFTYKRLLRFVLPSIVMMIFTSIYGVVDGVFVSNFVGKTPFAALNLIFPFIMVLGAFGFMLGTGGSALVAKTLGEGKKEEANRYFSFLIYTALVLGVVLAVLGIIFLRPIAILLGAEGEMVDYCVSYATIILAALPAFMLQNMFQSFLVTAEKPGMGLVVTVLAGVTNMALDAVFIVVLKLDLAGAALATASSQCVGGLVPFFYFARKNKSLLHLTKTRIMPKVLWQSSSNGISELLSNISMSLVSMLYNYQLIKMAGENGVAAYGVIMYVQFIFVAIFIGYAIGTAPIIGFNYGAKNHKELKSIFKKSINIMAITGIALMVLGYVLSGTLSQIFVSYDKELFDMTVRGMKIYSVSFMLCGFSIFASAFFTALNNGLVSAIISCLRTVVFQIVAVLALPIVMGIDGIWLSIVVAEFAALIVSVFFFVKMKNKYHYA